MDTTKKKPFLGNFKYCLWVFLFFIYFWILLGKFVFVLFSLNKIVFQCNSILHVPQMGVSIFLDPFELHEVWNCIFAKYLVSFLIEGH